MFVIAVILLLAHFIICFACGNNFGQQVLVNADFLSIYFSASIKAPCAAHLAITSAAAVRQLLIAYRVALFYYNVSIAKSCDA